MGPKYVKVVSKYLLKKIFRTWKIHEHPVHSSMAISLSHVSKIITSQPKSITSYRGQRFLDLIRRHPIGGNAKAFQLRGKFLLPAQWLMGHGSSRSPKMSQDVPSPKMGHPWGSQFSGKCWINLDCFMMVL